MRKNVRLIDVLLRETERIDDRQLKAFRRQLEAKLPGFIVDTAQEAREQTQAGSKTSSAAQAENKATSVH